MPVGDYATFPATKSPRAPEAGITDRALLLTLMQPYIAPMREFQIACTSWALRRGRAALFEGTGLGKTLQQLTWAQRGIVGVYHHVTPKHLARYADEFSFRLNEGNVRRHTLDRLESFSEATAGKRLTYKDLIA